MTRKAQLAKTDLRHANLAGAQLPEADLSEAKLHHATLRDTNLTEANLEGADLHRDDLRGASLREARLHAADLRDADLRGADLTRADLTDANLAGGQLDRADLTEADLTGADLTDTDVTAARSLVGARLEGHPGLGTSGPVNRDPQDVVLDIGQVASSPAHARPADVDDGDVGADEPVATHPQHTFADLEFATDTAHNVHSHDAGA